MTTGWRTVAEGFRTCRALGWSPLPLDPETKEIRRYSWTRCCVVPLSDDDVRQQHFPKDSELGVACGYGGLVVADVDAGGTAARKLLHDMIGPPVAVALGGRPDGFKAIYRAPWVEPPPELVCAALNYGTAGQALARAAGTLARMQKAAPGTTAHGIAAASHTEARRRQRVAKALFDKLQDAWIEAHRLIRSADASGNGIALQLLSFGKQAALPPSRHPKSPTGHYRWEGDPPTPESWRAANA